MIEKFSKEDIILKLKTLKGWEYKNQALERTFEFSNFSQAIGFIVQVGIASEKRNHHPDLYNSYTKVVIRLSTHDSMGITEKDFDLAKTLDKIL